MYSKSSSIVLFNVNSIFVNILDISLSIAFPMRAHAHLSLPESGCTSCGVLNRSVAIAINNA